jgi:hypothetical protein
MNQIDLTVTIDGPAPEAERMILGRIGSRLDGAGLTGRQRNGAVEYRPKFAVPAVVWLVRRLRGEGVTFTFDEQGPVTQVLVHGKLRDRAHAEITEALGGD